MVYLKSRAKYEILKTPDHISPIYLQSVIHLKQYVELSTSRVCRDKFATFTFFLEKIHLLIRIRVRHGVGFLGLARFHLHRLHLGDLSVSSGLHGSCGEVKRLEDDV